ncbi:MAG TPA: acetate--CoA ligase family protein, partial [Trebonia sp.]
GATGDLLEAVAQAAVGVPLAVVVLNQPEAVRLVKVRGGRAPAYAYPEVAARALSRAARYAEWRAAPRRTVPAFPDVDAERARETVHAFLSGEPGGGWLPYADTAGLLDLYRIPLVPVPVPPGTAASTEVTVAVRDDQMFGPLVILRLGGDASGVLDGRAARLVPLTEADADALIASIGSASRQHGYPGVPADGSPALRDLLLRVSRLTDDRPEITELDLHPVIIGPGSAVAVDAQIRVAPQEAQDPFLRRLR